MTGRDVEFTAMVEPVDWGRARYTVVRIPKELVEAAGAVGTRRVEGTFGDVPVNLAITRAPVVDGPFVWAGRSLLRRAGLEEGDLVEARLRPADPDRVDLPDDVAAAIDEAEAQPAWQRLTPAVRRRRLYAVESARSAAARRAAVTALVAELEP